MDQSTLFVLAGALIINLVIIYLIIKTAIDGAGISRHAEMQTELLIKMAKKAGVNEDEIIAIRKMHKKITVRA